MMHSWRRLRLRGAQRGAFTTPCPRRNAAPRPLVYKVGSCRGAAFRRGQGVRERSPRRAPESAEEPALAAEADKAATARGPAIPEAKSLIRARDGGAGRATDR